jgi:hypothetical protein
VVLSVLTFVPTPYLYSTRGGPLARTMNVAAVVWFVLLGFTLFGSTGQKLAVISLAYPLLYFALSAVVTVRRRRAILRP